MQEKTLYRISLVMVLMGLAILFLYAEELNLKGIESVETVQPSEPIKLYGTITRLQAQNKTLFLELEGSKVEKSQVIVFGEQDLFLEEGDYVEVSGIVEEYEGKKEIIASKVVKK